MLSQNQHFNDAREWMHYLFNPTISVIKDAKEYWQCRPLRDAATDTGSFSLLKLAAANNVDLTAAVENWLKNPFQPDVVAMHRPLAYNKAVVMSYLDNLISWADQLYSRDTIESINEATMLYILAANILGEKPRMVKRTSVSNHFTFNDKRNEFNDFRNVLVKLENSIPTAVTDSGRGSKNPATTDGPVLPVVYTPFFCIPHNEKILEYWDTVSQRLFNIRNCKNMQGIERQLPFWQPPIDTALLVRAAALGVDVSDAVNGQTLMPYKYQTLLRTSQDICNEVKALGGALLSALEKKDAEELTRLRSTHELDMLQRVRAIKEQQITESETSLEGLNKNRTSAGERYKRFQALMSNDKAVVPAKGQTLTFDKATITPRTENPQEEFKKYKLSWYESEQLLMMDIATGLNVTGSAVKVLSSVVHMLPNVTLVAAQFGGSNLGHAASATSDSFSIGSSLASHFAQRSSILGGYERRLEEWTFQSNSILHELEQIDKQILASEIRLDIVKAELANHDKQMEHIRQVDEWMRNKFSNIELYNWMQGQLFGMYKMAYNMALQLAKKAERAYGYELGVDSSLSFIKPNYWDNLKKGLLSGELLSLDLKRMEAAYLQKNKREYEIVKHISLALLDPLSLLQLKKSGKCQFTIPEVLFDMDFPGHYFRRIKSVSISIPCIAGPNTSVSSTLRITSNKIRKSAQIANNYTHTDNFISNKIAVNAIATSNAQNDSGIFELNFRDERYLPFEGAGVISDWELELPAVYNNTSKKWQGVQQFNYDTISDVIVHVKYTAREGGLSLKTGANAALLSQLEAIKQGLSHTGLHTAINMKHDMPNEWHLLKANGSTDLTIGKSRLPYMAASINTSSIESVMFVAKINDNPTNFSLTTERLSVTTETGLKKIDGMDLYKGINTSILLNTEFNLAFEEAGKLEELLLIVKYRF